MYSVSYLKQIFLAMGECWRLREELIVLESCESKQAAGDEKRLRFGSESQFKEEHFALTSFKQLLVWVWRVLFLRIVQKI